MLKFFFNNKLRKIKKVSSHPNTTNIAYLALMVFILSILVYFGGRDSKKPQGQEVNGVRFEKNFGFPIFLTKDKNSTPRQVEIPK